jgi:hypothetical protein
MLCINQCFSNLFICGTPFKMEIFHGTPTVLELAKDAKKKNAHCSLLLLVRE